MIGILCIFSRPSMTPRSESFQVARSRFALIVVLKNLIGAFGWS